MNDEPELFSFIPSSKHLARSENPPTSKLAAREVYQFANTHHRKIYDALSEIGDGTFYEIADACELSPSAVWRRLNEMEKAGIIHPTGSNRRGPTMRWCRVWSIS